MTNHKQQQYTFSDDYITSCRYWHGHRQAILYIHGIQSHGLWFEGSARYLADQGHAVLLADRRGSGKNAHHRADVQHRRRWLSDLRELTQHLCQLTDKPRVHLLAVSWGGKLAVAFARKHPTCVASLTLVAPGIYPAVDLPVAQKANIALAGAVTPTRLFAIPLNDPELFTDNVERQRFIQNDTLRLTAVTARFLLQSRRLDRNVRISDLRFSFPIKLFLAQNDRIIKNQPTLNLFRSWHARFKQVTWYPNTNHTLEFEPNTERYFRDLLEWIDYVA